MSSKKEKEFSDVISVYSLKQAEKFNGKFNKKLSNVMREGFKVSEKFAEAHNLNFDVSGSFYELDVKRTAEYNELVKLKSTPIVDEEE